MGDLVIGNTSQLAMYFDNNCTKISSRNIDREWLRSKSWDSVYICFAEQRTYLANSNDPIIRDSFWSTNVDMVLDLVRDLDPIANRIVYYSTAELWNKTCGPISTKTECSFHENHYTASKFSISSQLKDKTKYPKVCVAYPFNFNSVYRGEGYLFGKIFKSILTKTSVEIGDIDYYREILHPSMVVDMSKTLQEDAVIGTGRLIHIGDFIKKLYAKFDLDCDQMIIQKDYSPSIYRRNIFYSRDKSPLHNEASLLDTIVNELHKKTNESIHL
jgi:GDP-D-mannose dehydratase